MSRFFASVFFLIILAGFSSISFGSLTLVRNGLPASVIVVADTASPSTMQGANDLQMWIKKASGAVVPITKESGMAKGTKNTLILVGDTKLTRGMGIDPIRFALEEFEIKTFPGRLVIIGDDARPDGVQLMGTLLAVDAFAEQYLGVRVLWPGALGEVVPEKKTIRIGAINMKQKPFLSLRRIRNMSIILPSVQKEVESLGMKCDAFPGFHQESNTWFRFHRLYGSFEGALPHAFTQYWKRFHIDHPEWFALQPDGSRDNGVMDERYRLDFQPGELAQLCVSNRELVAQVAKDAVDAFTSTPTLDVFSISPNDDGTGSPSFCLCEKCEAMDAPDGKKVTISTLNGRMDNVSLSDRFVKFFTAVAEAVGKSMPDRYLGALAYSSYILPPVHATLDPHVIIGLVPNDTIYLHDCAREEMRDNWLKWSESSSRLFLRPNLLLALKTFPAIYVHKLGEDMRFFADHKIVFVDFDCCLHNWSTNGLNYYVLAKLLWDPRRDVEGIIDEYCRAGFGTASADIRKYFDTLERITTTMASENKDITPDIIANYYSDDVLDGLNGILKKADKDAKGDARILERIAFLRKGLEYAPISREYLLASEQSGSGADGATRLAAAKEKRAQWFRGLGFSWEISVPWALAFNY
jgi:hypothetical protein